MSSATRIAEPACAGKPLPLAILELVAHDVGVGMLPSDQQMADLMGMTTPKAFCGNPPIFGFRFDHFTNE
jgi:hypothetical protein